MIVKYKLAHKLSVFNLRAGLLRADKESMNILEDVVNRITIPTDPDGKFVYHSEWLTAAALTQTYAYMIETGLEYSKLVTGEADVFLHLKEDEPHSLYYHLAEPNIEAEAQSEVDILLFRTAVSLTLTFRLMALDSKPRGQKWRNHALETAYRAIIDHEAVLRQIPVEEKTLTPPPSVFNARIHPFKQSPIMLRPRKSRKAGNSCGSADVIMREDPQRPQTLKRQASQGLVYASLVPGRCVRSNHSKRLNREMFANDNTQANLVIISMAWPTREDARSYSRSPKDPDMDTLSYWL
jgi:hypothetical protein